MGGMTGDRFGGRDDNRRRGRRPRRRAGIENRLESLENRRLLADVSAIAANFGDYYMLPGGKQSLLRSGTDLIVEFAPGTKEAASTRLTGNGGALAGFTKLYDLGKDVAVFVRSGQSGVASDVQASDLGSKASAVRQDKDVLGASPSLVESNSLGRYMLTDSINVALNPGVDPATVFQGITGIESWRSLRGGSNLYVVKYSGNIGVETLQFATSLSARNGVRYAEPDAWIEGSFSSTNDPLVDLQWQLNNTGQTGGTPGASVHAFGAWNQNVTGVGVVVAIVDSGVQLDHPDLQPNLYANPHEIPDNGIDDDDNGYIDDVYGWDFFDDDNDANPDVTRPSYGHGTSVAGLAAAAGNNGLGVAGVAYNAKILPIRIDFPIAISAMTEAEYYASGLTASSTTVDWDAADVTNHSYSFGNGGSTYQTFEDAFMQSSTVGRNGLGVVNFAATGNGGVGFVSYPAAYPNVIAIGGTDNNDVRVGYSQYGPQLALMAPTAPDWDYPNITTDPGLWVVGTDVTGDLGFNNLDNYGNPQYPLAQVSLDYTTFNGTSAASPIAAGVGALAVAALPSATFSQIYDALIGTADKVGGVIYDSNGFNIQYGYGRVNAEAVVNYLATFQVSATTPSNGSSPTAVPSALVISFNRNVDMSTVSATDLAILAPLGLTVTVGVPSLVAGTTNQVSFPLTFQLGDSQITTGLIQYSLAADSIYSTDGRPLKAYSGNFIVPLADVTLLPEPVVPTMTLGQESTYTQQITLNGPEFTTGVTLMTQLPAGLTFVRASTQRGMVWYDAANHRVYAKTGNYLPSGIVEVSLTLRPVQAGQFQVSSEVWSDSLEVITSTNNITYPITVVDVPGVLRFSKTSYTVKEETTPHIVEFPVTRQEGSLGNATVTVKTIDGTAVEGVDYVLLTPQLTFPNGDRSPQYVQVQILTTAEWFASRTFQLELTDVSGATVGYPDKTNVTILDSQPAPVGTIVFKGATPNPVSESGGFITVEVERVDGISKQLAVTLSTANGLAIAGTNFGTKGSTNQFSQLITWAEGEMGSKFVKIPILQDGLFTTSALDFGIGITAANADTTITGLASETIYIENTTQTSNVTFNPVSYQVLEDAGSILVTVTRTIVPLPGGYIPALTVDYATANGSAQAGIDYIGMVGTLTWAVGDTSPKVIKIGIIDKPTTELDRNFYVNLSNVYQPVNGTITGSQASVLIKDTDIDSTGPKIGAVQFSGTATSVSQIYLTFNEALDVASATNPANYLVRTPGGQATLVIGVQYLAESNSVIVNLPANTLRANSVYYLTVNGTAPNGVKDIFGNLLDGSGTNGTNYDINFARGTSVTYVDNMNNRVNIGLRNGGFFDFTQSPNGQGQWLAIYNVNSRSILSGSVRRIDASSTGYTRIDTLSGIGNPWFIRVTMTTPPFYVNTVVANNPPLPGGASPNPAKMAVKKLRTVPARLSQAARLVRIR